MLEAILGSKNKEKVLLLILSCDEGYAREIARFFDAGLDQVQKQLDRLEAWEEMPSGTPASTILSYRTHGGLPAMAGLHIGQERCVAPWPSQPWRSRLPIRAIRAIRG